MKSVTLKLILLLLVSTAFCLAQNRNSLSVKKEKPYTIEQVSMINLIATPEKYNGKHVMLIGFFNLEFEGDALYLHKDDFLTYNCKNALWLDVDRDKRKEFSKFNKKYVFIEAVFEAGRMGLFSGTLKDIDRIYLQPYGHIQPHPRKDNVKFPPVAH